MMKKKTLAMFTTTIRHYDITFKIKTKVYDKYVNIFFFQPKYPFTLY